MPADFLLCLPAVNLDCIVNFRLAHTFKKVGTDLNKSTMITIKKASKNGCFKFIKIKNLTVQLSQCQALLQGLM
jgi:hypothetical protein